ncbi:MAG: Cys-tRNA(Pro) deacylase [Novosphingobium sp.]
MGKGTRATAFLDKAGVAYSIHTYDYDPGADRVGLQAAGALGEAPERVLKTLMVLVDGKPACAVLPSNREVAMKRLAAALGGKSAQMMPVPDAERVSGYKVGGVSPFGQLRPVRTVFEASVLAHPLVYINGGQRGLQVRLSPVEAVRVLGAESGSIVSG